MMAEYRRVEGLHSSSRRRCLIAMIFRTRCRNETLNLWKRQETTLLKASHLHLLYSTPRQDLFRIVPNANEHGGDEDSCVFYTR